MAGPYILTIFLAVRWTFSSSIQACVQGNVRYPVWLVYCGEEARKCGVSTELGTVTNKRCVILDEKSLLFFFTLKWKFIWSESSKVDI